MKKQQRLQWVITIIIIGVIFWTTTPISMALTAEAPTLAETYPDFADGILKSARLVKLDKGLILQADHFSIPSSFMEKTFGKMTPEIRKELEKNKLFLLDQEVIQTLIKEDAKAMDIATEPADEKMFQTYIERVTKDAKVTEKAARAFYDENREMVGGMPFDQVKGSIEQLLLDQKKQVALESHIQGLAQKSNMKINKNWVEKQVEIARDNPLDRARLSGKATMVQFSAAGCGPCEMMKPIVKKIKKKYAGSINVVAIPVRDNQMLAKRFNVRAVPVQVFFDKEGKEVHHHMGFMAEADIVSQLKKMGAI